MYQFIDLQVFYDPTSGLPISSPKMNMGAMLGQGGRFMAGEQHFNPAALNRNLASIGGSQQNFYRPNNAYYEKGGVQKRG